MFSYRNENFILSKFVFTLCFATIILYVQINYSSFNFFSKWFLEAQDADSGLDIMIVGQGRSGTSFLGEILNQNPKIMYIYEPLYPRLLSKNTKRQENNIIYHHETSQYHQEIITILQSLFSCNVTQNSSYLKQLISRPLGVSSSSVLDKLSCGINSELAARFHEVCLSFKYRAVKVLSGRLPNVSLLSLEGVVKASLARKREMKIIHIVRDPRAVVYSWMKYKWIQSYPDRSFYRNVESICAPVERNLKVRDRLPKWLENRYKFVQYEQMVLHSERVVREIYEFLGIPIVHEVNQWLKSRFKTPTLQDLSNRHSTIRNANLTINKWKKYTRKEERNLIEKACSGVLQKLKNVIF